MTSIQIFKRLYRDYTKKYLPKIFLSVFFSLLLAASTSAIAYLLDPAINELFIKQSSKLIFIIPFLIIVAFAIKGISLYLAKVIMIGDAEEVKKELQTDMFASLINENGEIINIGFNEELSPGVRLIDLNSKEVIFDRGGESQVVINFKNQIIERKN